MAHPFRPDVHETSHETCRDADEQNTDPSTPIVEPERPAFPPTLSSLCAKVSMTNPISHQIFQPIDRLEVLVMFVNDIGDIGH